MKHPVYLFSEQHNSWRRIARKLGSASGIVIFLDYDGTLTPIKRTPSAALLAPETELILKQLTEIPSVHLTIVTGRSMEDIRRLVPIDRISFAANHGIHILHKAKEWIHPEAVSLIQLLSRLYRILRTQLESFTKANVENKQFTLSVHYRNVPTSQEKALKSLATKTIHSFDSSLIITHGKKVLEVRPHISWGKGSAVLEIIKSLKSPRRLLPLYIGDDITDEDAFRVLRTKGVTIHIGKSISTNAEYYITNIEEVMKVLQYIIDSRYRYPPHQISMGKNKQG